MGAQPPHPTSPGTAAARLPGPCVSLASALPRHVTADLPQLRVLGAAIPGRSRVSPGPLRAAPAGVLPGRLRALGQRPPRAPAPAPREPAGGGPRRGPSSGPRGECWRLPDPGPASQPCGVSLRPTERPAAAPGRPWCRPGPSPDPRASRLQPWPSPRPTPQPSPQGLVALPQPPGRNCKGEQRPVLQTSAD